MSDTADAIIIGTGVIGTAIAYELAKQGMRTLSVDRAPQIGHGSTAGSCAIIRVHYSTLDGTAMAWEGYHDWAAWEDYLGLPRGTEIAKFRETGCLVMKTEANGHLANHMQNCRTLNCPFEEWDAAQVTARLPIYEMASYGPPKRPDDPEFGVANGAMRGGVFWPTAGYVTDPALSAQNIAQAAAGRGAWFRNGVEVTAILQEGGRVTGVRLGDGSTLSAPIVINVGGPGSNRLNAMAGVLDEMTIATRPLRQEVAHVPSPEGFDFERQGFVVSDSDIGCYIRPEHGNHILVGSEDPECDPHVWVEDDTDYSRDFTDQWRVQAMRYAQRVPSLPIPNRAKGVVDLYDASTDWIPIYDRTSLSGYYMACGTSGNQYKNAPVAGKLMAALIDYCENGGDHDAAPLRFTLPHTGYRIDAGFFSRRREVNQESSFSVLG